MMRSKILRLALTCSLLVGMSALVQVGYNTSTQSPKPTIVLKELRIVGIRVNNVSNPTSEPDIQATIEVTWPDGSTSVQVLPINSNKAKGYVHIGDILDPTRRDR